MSGKSFRAQVLIAIAILLAAPTSGNAQARTLPTNSSPARCAGVVAPMSNVSDKARIEAQQLAGRAQAASIEGDNAAATQLYQRAAQLDPSDAGIAYALGRAYEATRDARAMAEYCRFLALTPAAPEAADVRQRIAELALALPTDTTVVRVPVTAPNAMPSPGAALISGLIIPGLGQFITHRPTTGLLVMAATAAAAVYGLQSQNVTSQVTHTATDPLGHPYQYQTPETHSEHPHAAVGIGAAAAISVLAALDAFTRARSAGNGQGDNRPAASEESRLPRSVAPVLTFAQRSIGFGLSFQ